MARKSKVDACQATSSSNTSRFLGDGEVGLVAQIFHVGKVVHGQRMYTTWALEYTTAMGPRLSGG